jgi:hypothetical protein
MMFQPISPTTEFSSQFPDYRVIMIMDNAAWHGSSLTKKTENIRVYIPQNTNGLFFISLLSKIYHMKYEKIKKNSQQLLSLTGFTVSEFEALLPVFKQEWDEYNSHFTLKGEERQRISYGRKSGKLSQASNKLLFILSYLKNSPLQEFHGAMFGMTQPQCNDWIHLLSGILSKTLKRLGELPDRNAQRVESVLQSYNNVLLDGTERPIQRPQAEDRQKSCYSGKKNA